VNRVSDQGGSVFWKLILFVFFVALMATILIPQRRMREEVQMQKQTRLEIIDIYLAEKFFFEGRQRYTDSPDSLLGYLNAVRRMKVDTVGILAYALGDSIRETDVWRIVYPREPVRSFYRCPIDSSDYLIIVRENGLSITVKDRKGIGRIQDGRASWQEKG
jgi:hypothetical protein